MMAQNVRIGLEEYITSTVLENEIDEKYEELKVTLSELDAEYRLEVENAENKKIVVANASLKYLEKFNFEVYCIDSDATDKTITWSSSNKKIATVDKNGKITGRKR